MATMQIFVSHSHEDKAFCHAIVQALRDAGADVWYDEHNLGSGQLMAVVQRELGRRPVFIVILTKAAFASNWVKRETTWAYELLDRDPTRIILPVTAGPIERNDFDPAQEWLFLSGFKRIEDAGYQPLPVAEAVRRTLHALALTPSGATPEPTAPQAGESVEDLIARGKALRAQGKHAEALPLFQRTTELAPNSSDAWFQLGYTLVEMKQFSEGLVAYDRALALDPNNAVAWNNKGTAFYNLKRYDEALAAYDRALALDPNYVNAWTNKGNALYGLKRYDEALAALDRALALDPNSALAWYIKGIALDDLKRSDEAIAAYDRALALDPNNANALGNKGNTLYRLKRFDEAIAAYDRALAIDPNHPNNLRNKAIVLRALGRNAEAQACEERARALGG